MPDYANFDGTPYGTDEHKDFRFDAWRTLSNVAVDYAWFAADPWQVEQSNRVLEFLGIAGHRLISESVYARGKTALERPFDGSCRDGGRCSFGGGPGNRKAFCAGIMGCANPFGKWRYYDGMLYMLAMLHASGNFKIYIQG